ncbi:ferredoxin [Streptomyces sp. NPDC127117]|uniref:ferredoxin n=1 Tax=Streptomyces sp. NPDC127117 TaxID=3345368 RepID=UPI0036350044
MRVLVERDRCEGHGLCEERAAGLFHLDDEGELHLTHEGRDLPAAAEADASAAAGICPVAALKLLP